MFGNFIFPGCKVITFIFILDHSDEFFLFEWEIKKKFVGIEELYNFVEILACMTASMPIGWLGEIDIVHIAIIVQHNCYKQAGGKNSLPFCNDIRLVETFRTFDKIVLKIKIF